MDIKDISHSEEIYTVSRLNREVRLVLEGSFAIFWIEGEISNFVIPQSGHWYFSLKDSQAQLRCVMFKPQNRRLSFTPKDGMHVLLKASVSLYEGRGDFQLLVETMEEAGVGQLQKAFEALKKRLSAEGLFATAHKRSLPAIPNCIGVITSSTGAAIRDILHVLQRRLACVPVVIYPTLVQGELAASHIVKAIQLANERQECDVLIVARGGGSLEDLWPFNEEIVARAIYQSHIPIVTGIGHEIDFTISDFVADLRAPTPSAAAELVTPDKVELLASLKQTESRFHRLLLQKIRWQSQQLDFLIKQLQQQHPKRRLQEQAQRLDQLESSLKRALGQAVQNKQSLLQTYSAQLYGLLPHHRIRLLQQSMNQEQQHIQHLMIVSLQQHQQRLSTLAAKLNTLSPLATLERGFSMATLAKNGMIVTRANQVHEGDLLNLRLADGELACKVTERR